MSHASSWRAPVALADQVEQDSAAAVPSPAMHVSTAQRSPHRSLLRLGSLCAPAGCRPKPRDKARSSVGCMSDPTTMARWC